MNRALWVLQILLALAFLFAGSHKLITPREQLVVEPVSAWTNDFSAAEIKLIGVAEVLGAFGLVLPVAIGIAPVLTSLAGAGLTVLMLGAVASHARRGEPWFFPLVLALLAAVVAIGRYRIGATTVTRT